MTVGPDGTIYLAGSTTGTFAGQSRNIAECHQCLCGGDYSQRHGRWTQQFGGADGVSTGAGVAIDPCGSSVLDALGLPQGSINPNQSVDLTQQTTLARGRQLPDPDPGRGAAHGHHHHRSGRDASIRWSPRSTPSLADRQGRVNYTSSAEDMTITANPGNTINLIAGPADSDALARLGIPAGVISAPAKKHQQHVHKHSSVTTGSSSSRQADLRPGSDRHGRVRWTFRPRRAPTWRRRPSDRADEHPEHLSEDQHAAAPPVRQSGQHQRHRQRQPRRRSQATIWRCRCSAPAAAMRSTISPPSWLAAPSAAAAQARQARHSILGLFN